MNQYIEVLGMLATVILIISMAYNCKDKKSAIIMRIINGVAALMFVIYSICMSAYSTILSNLLILLIDIYYLIKLMRCKE